MIQSGLARKRVMVVEDEFLVSLLIEELLIGQGCEVVGPFSTLAEALTVACDIAIDAALLDVNLRGQKVYPLADILSARGIPFLLLSGYAEDAIPPDRPDWWACAKPFTGDQLIALLARRVAVGS